MKIKENAIKIIKERQRKEKRKGDTRRKYLISLPMDALKCHLLSCPPFLLLLLLLLAACHTLLPSCQLPFVMPPTPLRASFCVVFHLFMSCNFFCDCKLSGKIERTSKMAANDVREDTARRRGRRQAERECKVKKLEFRGDKQQFWIGP